MNICLRALRGIGIRVVTHYDLAGAIDSDNDSSILRRPVVREAADSPVYMAATGTDQKTGLCVLVRCIDGSYGTSTHRHQQAAAMVIQRPGECMERAHGIGASTFNTLDPVIL